MLTSVGGGRPFVFEIKVLNHLSFPIDKTVSMECNNTIYLHGNRCANVAGVTLY